MSPSTPLSDDRRAHPVGASSASDRTGDRRGILVVISSPSGAGKTTLARRLLGEFDTLDFSVSLTTRPPRIGERDGVDYVFVDDEEFDRLIARDEMAEWAVVHGNRYGTSRTAVEDALHHGRDVLFDVDWQGGEALGSQWPDDALKIFILPPDLDILEARLRGRATDSDEVIERRLAKAIDEIRHHGEYRHVIVNDVLDEAYDRLRRIYVWRRGGADDSAGPPLGPADQAAGRDHAVALIASAQARSSPSQDG